MTNEHDRSGGTADDAQDEILAAACNALDKAHELLSFIVRHGGKCTPPFIERCAQWVNGEYDPGTRRAKRCHHNWAKAKLDSTMCCTRCGVPRSVGCQ